MSFISFEPGETKTITPSPGAFGIRKTHWVEDRSVPCTGPDCGHCAGGAKVKISFILPIGGEDPDLKWEIGPQILDKLALIHEFLVIGKPRTLYVTRIGEGINTRWQIRTTVPTTTAKAAAAKSAEAAPGTFESAVYELLKGIEERLIALEEKNEPSELPF